MALLQDVGNIIIMQKIYNILKRNQQVINHYELFYKLLKDFDIFSPILVSKTFKGKYILVLLKLFNDPKFLINNKIIKHNNIYYISDIPIINYEIYIPTANELVMFKFKKGFLNTIRNKKQQLNNKGNTIFHDLILEKSYETIREMLNNNSFDTTIKNYLNITPLDYIDPFDEKLCNLFDIPYKKMFLRVT